MHTADLRDALDQAVVGTDLSFRRPRWWVLVGVLQVVLAAAALLGLLGLLALFVLDFLQVPYPEVPSVSGLPGWLEVPVPTALLVVGLARRPAARRWWPARWSPAGRAPGRGWRRRAWRPGCRWSPASACSCPVADVLADHRRCRDLLSA